MSTGAGAGPAAVDGPRMGVDMQQRSLLEAHLDQGLSGQTPGQAGRLKSDRQRAWTAELGVNGLMSIEYTPEDHRDGEKQDSPRNSTPVARPRAASESRLARFRALLAAPVVDIFQLRDLAWSGIPPELRPQAWRLLLGYAPAAQAERAAALKAKRDEYWHLVSELIDGVDPDQRSPDNQRTWRQIQVDVPRTTPEVRFFQHPRIRACIQRVLYVMSQRRTRTGYVQGMNDLLTPFLWTLLSEHLPILRASFRTCASSVDNLPEAALRDAEADAYGMFQSLLGVVQDNYTHTQPGIRRLALALQELTRRVDPALARHLVTQGADFLQFSLRWFNCLLVRELPFALSLRLWDTYVAELEQTQSHLLYASLALLLQWSKELQQRDFGGILTLLQRPPTTDWDEGDLESLLSKSFLLRSMLKDPKRGAAETGGSSV
ncbi:unnamed protein product [Pedinophyceae sp. YPF-701]|nr:unnamed protein product [Pedinophyceae sp. YPF-701]